jgi:ABC-type multidrug transport system fused ATPase/permease subunit
LQSYLTAEMTTSQTELLDRWAPSSTAGSQDVITSSSIGFKDVTFTWSKESTPENDALSSMQKFRLSFDEELKFFKGKINLVVGPTGSGKTSLLMSLLGECPMLYGCSLV